MFLAEHVIRTGEAHSNLTSTISHLLCFHHEKVEEEIQDMLFHDTIKPSSSQWAAPMAIIKKKDLMRFM